MKNWRMFAEIQALKTLGYKRSKVAKKLKLHFYTVDKYWDMEPEEFALQLEASKTRSKKPDKYREEILALLNEFPDMTASQLYDWLEERRQSNLPFSERTMRLYIADLRIEENIPKPCKLRQYEAVDDPPMGAQTQVDMGEIWLKDSNGKRVKVYCFAMVLSHSRYKYVCWQTMPFTTETFIESHEKAFAFLGGRTAEIVYDQDKILAVSENCGDIIYTEGFQSYLSMMKFKVYLCRGFDPESKGRVEAVVKFAKRHFANHRTFINIESFNADCIAWLHRKGNGREHQITHKIPAEVFKTERDYLTPVSTYEAIASSNSVSYQVRKDNTVLYKSNRYRLPKGTYQPGKRVLLRLDGASLIISDTDTNVIYARHTVSLEKGKIINLNHAEREQNKTQGELHQKVLSLFPDNPDCEYFLDKVKEGHKRYYKDQLSLIEKVSEQAELKDSRYKALEYCLKHQLFSATEFKAAIEYFNELKQSPEAASPKKGLSSIYPKVNPKVRDINEYKKLMEGKQMGNLEQIKQSAKTLNLGGLAMNADLLVTKAEKENMTISEFLSMALINELQHRTKRARERRIKEAGFPYAKHLEDFDLTFQKSITERQIRQLAELNWIEQMYNLMFFGPPGVGKTHLSLALAYKAAEEGYKVVYTTMTTLVQTLRTAEISRQSKTKLNRILRANLVVIDEVGYLPIQRTDANLFFQLIADIHEQASIILTSNKGFEDWTEFLGDEALTTAVLDRLTFRCDIITLNGKSYRLENRKSYLNQEGS